MKYTIELTNKQKAQMDCMMEIVHRYVGFNPKLEPSENSWESELEKHRKQAYDKGYNSAINDYNKMIQWLHDCTDDFKKFINTKYGYDVMYLTNPKVDEGVILYDLICDHDIAEVIAEFKMWQEEKKKAKEIKVGDEVITHSLNIAVVTKVEDNCVRVMFKDGSGFREQHTIDEFKKTGRHFDEVEQLLDKLRGA